MRVYGLVMAQDVRDLISHLPPQFKRKVKVALQTLGKDPHQAKELKDELEGLRSFRVARSRLILRINGPTVEIVAFGPRKNIYERAAQELSVARRNPEEDK